MSLKKNEARQTRVVELKERSSIDTLISRLGVLEVCEDEQTPSKKHTRHDHRSLKKGVLPKQWQDVPGPFLTAPENEEVKEAHNLRESRPQSRRKHRKESNLLLSLLCCVQADTEYAARPRIHQQANIEKIDLDDNSKAIPNTRLHVSQTNSPSPKPVQILGYSTGKPSQHEFHQLAASHPATHRNRPSLPRDSSSQTQNLLSKIPKTLSPQTTALLLAELAKPISNFDQDSGYIYMFWLTNTASATPEPHAAASLLSSALDKVPDDRRTSGLLQSFASVPPNLGASTEKTILLKIGRASNVQRRLNEWTRQCNYNVSLIRYYPYHPSSSMPSPIGTPAKLNAPPHVPRKVPHAHRVERLIHLELTQRRVKRLCENCGKEHREWFEVDASREGIRDVDEVIRRWVAWAESGGGIT
ncbi:hypothetical protein MMC06_001024 [Schaereria dolodes]|nr:hypothetical protein [Schaereria dolodes]